MDNRAIAERLAAHARELDEHLGVTTVPELEAAARDGRLDRLGLPAGRLRKLREALAQRQAEMEAAAPAAEEPSLAALLAVDADYRRQVDEGALTTITPE